MNSQAPSKTHLGLLFKPRFRNVRPESLATPEHQPNTLSRFWVNKFGFRLMANFWLVEQSRCAITHGNAV